MRDTAPQPTRTSMPDKQDKADKPDKPDKPDKSDKAHRKPTNGEQPALIPPSSLFINREISQLAFVRRVLAEATAERHPLLERVKFLAFVGSQIDEFVMVRVAGLRDKIAAGVQEHGPDGMTPAQALAKLRPLIKDLLADQLTILGDTLIPQLASSGIELLQYDQLTRAQREAAAGYFTRDVLPVLTPLGVDPGHPFPHISSRILNLAVTLRDERAGDLFARLKVPASLPRLVPFPLPGQGKHEGKQ